MLNLKMLKTYDETPISEAQVGEAHKVIDKL